MVTVAFVWDICMGPAEALEEKPTRDIVNETAQGYGSFTGVETVLPMLR